MNTHKPERTHGFVCARTRHHSDYVYNHPLLTNRQFSHKHAHFAQCLSIALSLSLARKHTHKHRGARMSVQQQSEQHRVNLLALSIKGVRWSNIWCQSVLLQLVLWADGWDSFTRRRGEERQLRGDEGKWWESCRWRRRSEREGRKASGESSRDKMDGLVNETITKVCRSESKHLFHNQWSERLLIGIRCAETMVLFSKGGM